MPLRMPRKIPKEKTLIIRIDKKTYDFLGHVARKLDITRSEMVRRLIHKEIIDVALYNRANVSYSFMEGSLDKEAQKLIKK